MIDERDPNYPDTVKRPWDYGGQENKDIGWFQDLDEESSVSGFSRDAIERYLNHLQDQIDKQDERLRKLESRRPNLGDMFIGPGGGYGIH